MDTNAVIQIVKAATQASDAGGLTQLLQAGPLGLYAVAWFVWKKFSSIERRLARIEDHLGTTPPFKHEREAA